MGRCRNLGRNVARYHVKLSRKKTDKIFKKKKKQPLISDDSMNDGIIEKLSDECHITKELSTESIPEEMCVDEISEAEPKKTPVFREGKLRRTDLPFHLQDKQKGNERTDRVKPKAAKTSVVAARQMSKKKARKIMRAQRREQRQKQRLASTMER
ncbi:unnamed protein product [Toxocara canis]|uniref:Uncharacterized protein n=1 Tax=Toxocara canis TaxID=6265 RepID=A0A183UPW9_TOXCA|nr:unnamed protein product [Toxocara canis]